MHNNNINTRRGEVKVYYFKALIHGCILSLEDSLW